MCNKILYGKATEEDATKLKVTIIRMTSSSIKTKTLCRFWLSQTNFVWDFVVRSVFFRIRSLALRSTPQPGGTVPRIYIPLGPGSLVVHPGTR
jgi:hypothetical protein